MRCYSLGMLVLATFFIWTFVPERALPQTTVEQVQGDVAPPVPGEALTVQELLEMVVKLISDWRSVGWMAGMVALINILINLLRLPFVDDVLHRAKLKWLKPLLASMLGAILTALLSIMEGGPALSALAVGAIAGLAAVGLHELADKRHKVARAR